MRSINLSPRPAVVVSELLGEGDIPYDCTTDAGRDALALFLTGEVGAGADDGFLPSGFSPGQNLAAQKITLLINLNLGAILEPPAIPLLDWRRRTASSLRAIHRSTSTA